MIDEFAQIVGLLSAFASGRDSGKAHELAEFTAWLVQHNHQELSEKINTSTSASIFVKAYLHRQLPEIQSKIDILTAMVEVLIRNQNTPEEDPFPRNTNYTKNVLILILERDVAGKCSVSDLNQILAYVEEVFIGEAIPYSRYVLQQIIREVIELKGTPYEVVNRHWHAIYE